MSSDLLKADEDGYIRTDMNCTECGKNFITKLDAKLDGNHKIKCPYCGHDHFRVITAGVVTGERWDSAVGTTKVDSSCIWKSPDHPIVTSQAGAYMRSLWLRKLR